MGERNLTLEAAARLAVWYPTVARELPWRATRNPYHIWLSEIILQQTRVRQGLGYYERFLVRFPTLQTLAAAPLDDVLKAWEGLGYYTRARNLHATAQHLIHTHAGEWPNTALALEQLRGIGPYTARAIASICFEERVAVVDGNVLRVLSRLYGDDTPINASHALRHYQTLADGLLQPNTHPAAHNQAMMELGATICTPTKPSCGECPLGELCISKHSKNQSDYPKKLPRKPRTTKYFEYYVIVGAGGTIRLRQRDTKSYWKGLWELPSDEVPSWADLPPHGRELFRLKHDFTHFQLHIRANEVAEADWQPSPGEVQVHGAAVGQYAISRAVQKVLQGYLAGEPNLLFG